MQRMGTDGTNWVHPQHDSSREGGEKPDLPESSMERLLFCSLEWEKGCTQLYFFPSLWLVVM